MTKTLTIISIIGGIASTVSLLNGILLAGTTNSYEVIGFALVILLAAYVLFVPNTKLEQNVSGKIRTYDINKKPQLIDIKQVNSLFQDLILFQLNFLSHL
jgi:ABC-type nickel/cobalt efflux system permease component RcnA